MRILIVEDDEILGNGLTVGLQMNGFTADLATCRGDADAALRSGGFDAIVLDVMLPDGSGHELLATIRGRGDATPVLLLTALDTVADRVEGLDGGADDHLGKPFDLDEVAARLRALVRRASNRPTAHLEWDGVRLNPAKMLATRGGEDVRLSRREFKLLHALMERPGTILSKAQLEEKLYGFQEGVESNAVEVHIHNLRAKFGRSVVETVRGVGYRLREAGR
ncbi:response regulator transcription factor [Aurantimonas sp. C2-6-R+9]|uniref:response regulator transcription factor n=1 Tax=unclassified Aurantimonas TaxID=2638230 RepID=UPI002E18A74A|nr:MULTISPECIES: response regulator transcription factor [unclassified Aurantimonas]MEC5291541.1 response regulator transcription factor [Aurantimonas sp. C2-3-R2]MEC5324487.1 response regulator transcription factor [Aurantimonas sp. A3-2-R12]MEC5381689.1 response regulator transcription factor [Aurantimonas sp. C2-6-R+9]MEC5412627.1 response regulator transcription factor [Aurantimonas sp. C2-4-R8]